MVLSEFHLTLIAAGGAAVVVVWLYNLTQERKHRKAAEQVFSSQHPDVLLPQDGQYGQDGAEATDSDGSYDLSEGQDERIEPQFEPQAPSFEERIEPVFGADEAGQPTQTAVPSRSIPVIEAPELEEIKDPDFAGLPPLAESRPASIRPARQTLSVKDASAPDESLSDPVIEVSIAVAFDLAQALNEFWGPLMKLPPRAATHLRCIGRQRGQWKEITGQDNVEYEEVQLLLQLADRQGAITEAELVPFIQAVESAAALVGGRLVAPPVPDVLAHARSLDEFCASVDIQMAVHVVSRTGGEFAGSKLRALMEANGFKLKADGLFHLSDDVGNTQLSLSNFGAAPFVADELRNLTTHGVTFWLDVPRVGRGPFVFDKLVTIARQLADAVDGVLVDDQRRALADPVLASIRAKIDEIQQAMARYQLPAGGRRALRLFR
ncbi:MAG TPA: cell division protein ZipA C-terminal FtsZ-binding domain-containing protein [Rhodocyclaceae bacterium]|nr:cell division protein ZipA C-terminal FtsZ-binding domain-containing protein [Rhodocyclaceae bacterium]